MAIYKYKLTFDKFPNFFREYEVKATDTLYKLHRCIQNDLDFDEAQLSVFYSSNKNWEKHRTYPLFDMGEGSMDMISFEMLMKQKVLHLLYTFDLYNERSFKLELVGEEDEVRLTSYPRVVTSKNDPPDQLLDTEPVAELPFINDTSTPPSDDELDDFDDDDEDDEDDDDEVEELFEEAEGV